MRFILSIMSNDFFTISFLFSWFFAWFFYRLRLQDLCAFYYLRLLLACTYLMFCLKVLVSCLIVGLTLYLILRIFIAGCVLFGVWYFHELNHINFETTKSLIGGDAFWLCNPCFSILMLFLFISRYVTFKCILFITFQFSISILKGNFFRLLKIHSSMNNQILVTLP